MRLSRSNCSHRRKDKDLQRTYESCCPPDSTGRSASCLLESPCALLVVSSIQDSSTIARFAVAWLHLELEQRRF